MQRGRARYLLTLAYEGTGFHGWQRNPHGLPSVQQAVLDAARRFAKCCDASVYVTGSSRTDAGVHALASTAHVDLPAARRSGLAYPGGVVERGLNYFLQTATGADRQQRGAVAVLAAQRVPLAFHARHQATARTYQYRFLPGLSADQPECRAARVFVPYRAWVLAHPLDPSRMQAAATLLLGTHDFSTFRAAGCGSRSPVRTVSQADVTLHPLQGDWLASSLGVATEVRFTITANAFLYHQIRLIAGTLAAVGRGQVSLAEFHAMFRARQRSLLPPMAPAHALYLTKVHYSNGIPSVQDESVPCSSLDKI